MHACMHEFVHVSPEFLVACQVESAVTCYRSLNPPATKATLGVSTRDRGTLTISDARDVLGGCSQECAGAIAPVRPENLLLQMRYPSMMHPPQRTAHLEFYGT